MTNILGNPAHLGRPIDGGFELIDTVTVNGKELVRIQGKLFLTPLGAVANRVGQIAGALFVAGAAMVGVALHSQGEHMVSLLFGGGALAFIAIIAYGLLSPSPAEVPKALLQQRQEALGKSFSDNFRDHVGGFFTSQRVDITTILTPQELRESFLKYMSSEPNLQLLKEVVRHPQFNYLLAKSFHDDEIFDFKDFVENVVYTQQEFDKAVSALDREVRDQVSLWERDRDMLLLSAKREYESNRAVVLEQQILADYQNKWNAGQHIVNPQDRDNYLHDILIEKEQRLTVIQGELQLAKARYDRFVQEASQQYNARVKIAKEELHYDGRLADIQQWKADREYRLKYDLGVLCGDLLRNPERRVSDIRIHKNVLVDHVRLEQELYRQGLVLLPRQERYDRVRKQVDESVEMFATTRFMTEIAV